MNRWDNYTDTLGELCHSELFHAVRRIGGHDTSDLDKSYNKIKNNKTTKQMNKAANDRSSLMGDDKRREALDNHLREYAKKRMPEWVNGPEYFGKFESKMLGPYSISDSDRESILLMISKEIEEEEQKNMVRGKLYTIHPNSDIYEEILKDVINRVHKRALALRRANAAADKEKYHSGTGKLNAHGPDFTDMHSNEEYARDSMIARRKGKRW